MARHRSAPGDQRATVDVEDDAVVRRRGLGVDCEDGDLADRDRLDGSPGHTAGSEPGEHGKHPGLQLAHHGTPALDIIERGERQRRARSERKDGASGVADRRRDRHVSGRQNRRGGRIRHLGHRSSPRAPIRWRR
jgi:hypothetical protein